MRALFRLVVCCTLLGGAAALASAQDAPAAGENKLLALMPELRKLPGPGWVKEGARVSYHSGAATIAAERFYYYKDHHDAWQRGDEVGPAGAGISQYTVIARTDTGVIGMLENYTIDAAGGVMVPSYVGGTVDPAGAGACWANPGALAHADRFQSRELTVLKMPYPLGGHTYQTVRFHHVTNQSVLDSVYDLDSGVLLLSSSVVLSSDGRHTQLTQMTYLGRRQLELPAADLPAPDWLGAVRQLRYQGAITVQMAGMPQFPMPMSLSLQKTGGGARWARYEVSRQTQGQLPGSMELICGAGGLCGEPWMSPAWLKELRAGQVLDRDPHTQATMQVEQAGAMVVISQTGPGFKRVRCYDRVTGREVALTTYQQVGQAIHQTRLQLAQ